MIHLLLTAPLVLAALAAAVWSYRSLTFGATLSVLVYLISAVAVTPITLQAGGLHVYLDDILGGLLVAAAAARLGSQSRYPHSWHAWMPFGAATALAFVLGAAWYGVKAAGVEYRGFFTLCAAVFYCSSFPLDSRQMKHLVGAWLGGAAVLMALAWFRWSAELLNLGIAAQWAMVGGSNPWRVLNASQALFLAQACLILLYLRRHGRPAALLSLFAALLAITVLLLQHRSVWIATGLAWTAMAWHEGQLWRFLRVAVPAAALLLLAYGQTSEWHMPSNPVVESLEASAAEPLQSENSTLAWRIGLWSEYLGEYATLPAWQKLVGTGLGNGAVYRIGPAVVENSAHNYFVFVLNRAGILGLLALVGGYGALVWRLRGTGGCFDYIGMLLILTISQVIYSIVYSPSYEQGLLIGAGFGVASGRVARAGT